MRPTFNSELSSLIALIREELGSEKALYIVGGAVRDALLGCELHDLDFVMAEEPTSLAKRLAKRLNSGFFVLDDERHTARIAYHNSKGVFFPLDFVQFTGSNLVEDLKNRDFTINAMAISIRKMNEVIDPLDGQDDLKSGLIRTCNPRSLLDDPVRVLRGVRLVKQFNYEYMPKIEGLMREAAQFLPETSYERQRDEFFRILEGPGPAEGLRDCLRFQVFETLIPHLVEQRPIPASPPHTLPLLEHTFSVVENYHRLLILFHQQVTSSFHSAWWIDRVKIDLNQYANKICAYFEDKITPGRTKLGLSLLAALLHDIGKPLIMKEGEDGNVQFHGHEIIGAEIAWETAQRLKLSNAESDWIRIMVRYHMQMLAIINSGEPPNRRAIYRFFKKTGEVGVAIVFLSLADTIATFGPKLNRDRWNQAVTTSKIMLSAWWEHKDTIVSPNLLMDGYELQTVFGLKPGKQIGFLLGALEEAQASGEILTKEEAKAFIRKQLL